MEEGADQPIPGPGPTFPVAIIPPSVMVAQRADPGLPRHRVSGVCSASAYGRGTGGRGRPAAADHRSAAFRPAACLPARQPAVMPTPRVAPGAGYPSAVQNGGGVAHGVQAADALAARGQHDPVGHR